VSPRRAVAGSWVAAAAALLLGGHLVGCEERHDEPARSAILIVLDAASVRHFGVYGYPEDTTPQIDHQAATADVFLNAYSPAAYTRAAMLALFTSREPGAEGALEAPRLAERLAARGVHTAAFVGNPNAGSTYSYDRGFAEFHESYTEGPQAGSFRTLLPRFLEANRGRRFFVYIHYREPHFPYDPPPAFAERFPLEKLPHEVATDKRLLDSVCGRVGGPTDRDRRDLSRLYDANLAYVDREIGWLWKRVVAAGLAGTTAVVVTAEHGHIGHNQQVYDESVHVPLIVRRPGSRSSRRHGALVSLTDVGPTILGLLGFDEATAELGGRDLLASGTDEPSTGTVLSRSAVAPLVFALRDPEYAFLYWPSLDTSKLFDRHLDPEETRDLSATRPDLVRRYRARLLERTGRLRYPVVPPAVAVTPEVRRRLEALGYLE
jgi:arylsulfatase A-like enzyme